MSALLIVAWCGTIGLSLVRNLVAEKPPPNPSTPRTWREPSGLPVFPGATGFGTRTVAGRGGKVLWVTTLEDQGPGSLRSVLNSPGPRTIVFRVGGIIELESELQIWEPFVTVAGQTAPGGGICLKHAGLVILTHDVLVQHLRVRPGREGSVKPDTNDALQVLGGNGKPTGAHRVVLDHISASWSEDELSSTWFGAHDITFSHCIFSEALNRSRHSKHTHSAGLLLGNHSYNVTVHHCLLAHIGFRNPLISDGGTHEFSYNVIYNWGEIPAEILDQDSNSFLNFKGNLFKRGLSSRSTPQEIVIHATRGRPRLYLAGNRGLRGGLTAATDWEMASVGWTTNAPGTEYRASTPFPSPSSAEPDPSRFFESVLSCAGATRPARDQVDQRIVAEVRDGRGRIIDHPSEVGGYPRLESGIPYADTDGDGMADSWEKERGLNPSDPNDSSQDSNQDGYTNLEEFLHALTREGVKWP